MKRLIITVVYITLTFGAFSAVTAEDLDYSYFRYYLYVEGGGTPPPSFCYLCANPIPEPFEYIKMFDMKHFYGNPVWATESGSGGNYNCYAHRSHEPDPPDGIGPETDHAEISNSRQDILYPYYVYLTFPLSDPDEDNESGSTANNTNVERTSLGEVKASFE